MTITLLRNYRLNIVTRTNECMDPSMEVGTGIWSSSGFGSGGAGTQDRSTGVTWVTQGTAALHQRWSTAPTSNAGAGFKYTRLPWLPGVTKTLSGWMWLRQQGTRFQIHVDFRSPAGTILGTADTASGAFVANADQQLRVWLTTTAPDGVDHADVTFSLASGAAAVPVGADLYLDAVLFESAPALASYFDGSVGAGKVLGDGVSWAGTAHQDISYYSRPDPNSIITPDLVIGYDDEQAGTATAHVLLSGLVTATWNMQAGNVPGSTRTGTLRLLFGGDSGQQESYGARQGLMGNYPWHYSDTDNPEADMMFIPAGPIRRYQSESRATWLVDVPFQELSAAPWKAPVG